MAEKDKNQPTVEELQAQLKEAKQQISGLQSQNDELEGQVTDKEQDLVKANQELDSVKARLKKQADRKIPNARGGHTETPRPDEVLGRQLDVAKLKKTSDLTPDDRRALEREIRRFIKPGKVSVDSVMKPVKAIGIDGKPCDGGGFRKGLHPQRIQEALSLLILIGRLNKKDLAAYNKLAADAKKSPDAEEIAADLKKAVDKVNEALCWDEGIMVPGFTSAGA